MGKGFNKIMKQAPFGSWDTGSELLNVFVNPAANVSTYGEDAQEILDRQEEAMRGKPATNKSPREIEDASAESRRNFYAKQALLAGKNENVKTSSLGSASDTLQTSRKALLGGA